MRKCDKVLKFSLFGGGTSLVMALANRGMKRQRELHALNKFSSSLDKVSFKKTACFWAL